MIKLDCLNEDSYSIKEILKIAGKIFHFDTYIHKNNEKKIDKTLDTYIRRYFKNITPYSKEPRNTRYSKKDVENFFQDKEVFDYFLEKSKDQIKAWNNIAEEHAKMMIKNIDPNTENVEIEFVDLSKIPAPKVFSGPVDPAVKEFGNKVAAKNKDSYEVPPELIRQAKIDIALDYIFKECINVNENELEKDLWNNLYGDFRSPETAKSIHRLNNPSSYYKK